MGNVNLARIPEDWGLTYGSGPQIIFLDSSVLGPSGKPSIRLERHTAADMNTYRECDGKWYAVKPGDHIVAKVRILMQPGYVYSGSDPAIFNGGRLGLDFDGPNGSGNLTVLATHPTDAEGAVGAGQVHWGEEGWIEKTWDVIVPNTVFTVDRWGAAIPATQITYVVIWLDGRPVGEPGLIWFADAELYINPDVGPGIPTSATATINESGETVWTANGYSGNLFGWTDKIAEQAYDPIAGVLSVKVEGSPDETGTRYYWTNTVNVVSGLVSGWVMGDVVPKAGRFLSLSSVTILAIGSVGMLWLLNELRSKKRQRRRR